MIDLFRILIFSLNWVKILDGFRENFVRLILYIVLIKQNMVIPPEQAIERKMERKCNNAFLVCGLHKAKFAFPAHFLVFCWRITYSSATPRGKIYANRISHNERMLSRCFFLFHGETQCHEASVCQLRINTHAAANKTSIYSFAFSRVAKN